MDWLQKACEEIDAGIFTGELVESPDKLEMLKEYMGRWQRAIDSHEKSQDH